MSALCIVHFFRISLIPSNILMSYESIFLPSIDALYEYNYNVKNKKLIKYWCNFYDMIVLPRNCRKSKKRRVLLLE